LPADDPSRAEYEDGGAATFIRRSPAMEAGFGGDYRGAIGARAFNPGPSTCREVRPLRWPFYAAMSALFAGLTAVLAKVGVNQVPSNLATLVRTMVVVAFAAAVVGARGEARALGSISGRDWAALVLSGLATGVSWLFYFAALKEGPISGVAPIDKLSFVIAMGLGIAIFGERVNPIGLVGAGLIVVGVLLTLAPVQEALRAFFS